MRSPGDVVPHDVECEGFGITYTRIACDKTVLASAPGSSMETDVDKKVDDSIEAFLRSLSQIGPELMSVSLYMFVHVHVHVCMCVCVCVCATKYTTG